MIFLLQRPLLSCTLSANLTFSCFLMFLQYTQVGKKLTKLDDQEIWSYIKQNVKQITIPWRREDKLPLGMSS